MLSSKTTDGVALCFGTNGASLSRQSKPAICCSATNVNMESKTNLYKVLSLESEAVGIEEIKKAYRRMARRCHPDVCPPSRREESTRMFMELHRAYETLSNPALRREYDDEIRMNKQERRVGTDQFARETWEAQLLELRKRSDRREMAGSRRDDYYE